MNKTPGRHYLHEPKVLFEVPDRITNSSSRQPLVLPKWGRYTGNEQIKSRTSFGADFAQVSGCASTAGEPHLKRAEPWGRLYNVASRLAAYLGYHGTVEAKSDLGLLLVDALTAIDGSNYCPGLMPAQAEPQWGPILDELDALPNDLRPEFAKLDRLIRAEHERTLDRIASPCCPTCGTHEVSQQQTCHNSACEEYGRDPTIYEGWRDVQKSSLFASEHGGNQELPRELGADGSGVAPSQAPTLTERLQQKCSDWGTYWRASDAHGVVLTQEQALELLRDALGVEVEFVRATEMAHAEALRGLRNLKVLLGIDAPEVRGWAPAVQQAAQRSVTAAIRVLVTYGVDTSEGGQA